jgi:hypothetical protein
VEAADKIMKTFPECQRLQLFPSCALRNLTLLNIGTEKAAVVTNHLGSAILCANACWALKNIAVKSKENICLIISLGGGATMAKVRAKWLNNEDVQRFVRVW